MDLAQVIQTVENGIKNLPFPQFDLPPWLLFCVTTRRTGLSVGRIVSNVYAWMQSAGIPTGVNPDGTPNLIGGMSAAISKAIVDEICENGYVSVASAPGDISIQAQGGNAGGPVTVIGFNTNFSAMKGIIR